MQQLSTARPQTVQHNATSFTLNHALTTTQQASFTASRDHPEASSQSPQQPPIWTTWHTDAQRIVDCSSDDRLLDIVLVHCNKDTTELASALQQVLELPAISTRVPCLHLYSKSCSPGAAAGLQQAFPWASHVSSQPNQGREGAAYLAYIIDNYYSLPRHVLFLQDDMHTVFHAMLPKLKHLFR